VTRVPKRFPFGDCVGVEDVAIGLPLPFLLALFWLPPDRSPPARMQCGLLACHLGFSSVRKAETVDRSFDRTIDSFSVRAHLAYRWFMRLSFEKRSTDAGSGGSGGMSVNWAQIASFRNGVGVCFFLNTVCDLASLFVMVLSFRGLARQLKGAGQ
jgi:hypothetical protein